MRFAVWAPNAEAVYAIGDWNGWGDGTALQPQGSSGIWAGVCAEAVPGTATSTRSSPRAGAPR